jgi:hypothetical protein
MSDDWPYDPDGEEGSEGGRKYGHAVIAKKIDEDEDFPLSRKEFVKAHGDEPVRIDYETVVSVRETFDGIEQEEFEDFPDLHTALGRNMRGKGYWSYEGSEEFVAKKKR